LRIMSSSNFSPTKKLVLLLFLVEVLMGTDRPSVFDSNQSCNNALDWLGLSLYDSGHNPAFFKLANSADFSLYSFGVDYWNNAYRRHFDSEQVRNYDLCFYNVKTLNERATIASYAGYARMDFYSQPQSLEKNFYDHYFALVDTTTGNLSYKRPHLGFLYNHSLTAKILTGFEINYGVERGLKDVYTRCETILRDVDLKTGIGLDLSAIASHFGIYGRIFNRQGKYESVQEQIAPQVFTYFGYHVVKRENATDLIRKNDSDQGYEVGLNLMRANFIWSDLTLFLSGSWLGAENEVTVGSIARPEPRGYGVGSEKKAIAVAQYFPPNKRLGFRLSYTYQNLADWAKSGLYDVLILDNKVQCHQGDVLLRHRLNSAFGIVVGGSYEITFNDYREYIVNFIYDKNQSRTESFIKLQARPTVLISIDIGGSYSNYIPDFHWNTRRFQVFGFQTVIERLTAFGVLGFSLNCGISTPQETTLHNFIIGIGLYLKKNY